MSKAFLKIKEQKRPISGETIGFRIQAAVPNNAGGRFDKKNESGQKVSFAKKYMVGESSDHSAITEDHLVKFVENLKWQGYNEFELL